MHLIGTDLIDIRRLLRLIEKKRGIFLQRYFNIEEILRSPAMGKRQVASYFAKRFAAKEAFVKCIGGIADFQMSDIVVMNRPNGQPYFLLTPVFVAKLRGIFPEFTHLSLSLSDEWPYALATVIIDA